MNFKTALLRTDKDGMPDPVPLFRKKHGEGSDTTSMPGEGSWEMDLWDGSAWFSQWFYGRLQWSTADQRKTLVDLEPYLEPDAWADLLLTIREHLEERVPFQIEFFVQLPGGGSAWWQMHGHAESSSVGHPVGIAGSMREISADRNSVVAEGGT